MLILGSIIAGFAATAATTGGIGLGSAAVGATALGLGGAAIKTAATVKTVDTVAKTAYGVGKACQAVKAGSAISKTVTAARCAGAARNTYGAVQAVKTTVNAASAVKTTVAASKGAAEIANDIITAAAKGTSDMIRQVPFVGDLTAEMTNAIGRASGKVAANCGANEVTASIINGTVTTSGNVATMKGTLNGAKKLTDILNGNQECTEA